VLVCPFGELNAPPSGMPFSTLSGNSYVVLFRLHHMSALVLSRFA
jgi:hypothetical protein